MQICSDAVGIWGMIWAQDIPAAYAVLCVRNTRLTHELHPVEPNTLNRTCAHVRHLQLRQFAVGQQSSILFWCPNCPLDFTEPSSQPFTVTHKLQPLCTCLHKQASAFSKVECRTYFSTYAHLISVYKTTILLHSFVFFFNMSLMKFLSFVPLNSFSP